MIIEENKVKKIQSLSKETQNKIYLKEMAKRTSKMTLEIMEEAEEESFQRMKERAKKKGFPEWTNEELLELLN